MQSDTLVAQQISETLILIQQRIKVHIQCRNCGETFILRGIRDGHGNIETGFKKCLCDNDRDFSIEALV